MELSMESEDLLSETESQAHLGTNASCDDRPATIRAQDTDGAARGTAGARGGTWRRRDLTAVPVPVALAATMCLIILVAVASRPAYTPRVPAAGSDSLSGAVTLNKDGDWMTIVTPLGAIQILLDSVSAPQTVAKMKQIISAGMFINCVFYRAEKGFVIQGGLMDEHLARRPSPYGSFPLEANRNNTVGTVAMARGAATDSGTGEFFINLVDNPSLDAGRMGAGYTVFGKVEAGMDVADQISARPTKLMGQLNILVEPVVMQNVVLQ